ESRYSSYSNLSCISVAWGDLLSPQRRGSIYVKPIGSSRRHMTGLTIRLVISRRCLLRAVSIEPRPAPAVAPQLISGMATPAVLHHDETTLHSLPTASSY